MLPPITQAILIANGLAYLLEMTMGDRLVFALALWPWGPQFQPWQLVTYAFLHAGIPHLAINMFAVYMFGADMERVWGPRRYLAYYMVCAIFAGLSQLTVVSLLGDSYPTLGASGAVFGLLLAFAIYFPNRVVVPLFPPIPMPAKVFVILYGALEIFLGVTGTQEGVAHFAHLGGMLGGYLMIRYWRAHPGRWRR
jgi:membrane associated rhomboid family serine protease